GDEAMRRLWAGTFHHIAHLALRRHARAAGLPERYAILDRADARELVARCIADEGGERLSERRFPQAPIVQSLISFAVTPGRPLPAAPAVHAARWLDVIPMIGRVADRFAARKAELGLCDFDDLLVRWRDILRSHPDIAREHHDRFVHVLVDEYQDTNRLQ